MAGTGDPIPAKVAMLGMGDPINAAVIAAVAAVRAALFAVISFC